MTDDLQLLLQQLTDETRSVRATNLAGLSDLPRTEATEAFAALAALNPRRRVEVVTVMTEQAEANVHLHFHAILRECLTDVQAEVRKIAIDGLWEDERPTLIAPMMRILAEDPAPEVRAAAAISIGRFVLQGVLGEISENYAERAEQALRAAWAKPGEAVEVRRRALEGLAYTDEAGVDELIESAYYNEDDLMRQSAVFAMGRTADRRWARVILTELASIDAAMRYEAAGAAGELGLLSAVKPLIRLLEDADATVREASALALGKIGGREAKQALQACLEASDRALADAATDALDELAFNSESPEAPLLEYEPPPSRSGSAEDEDLDEVYDPDYVFDADEDREDDTDDDEWAENDENDDEDEDDLDEFLGEDDDEDDFEDEVDWRGRR
jgi:HEAT repeat protein